MRPPRLTQATRQGTSIDLLIHFFSIWASRRGPAGGSGAAPQPLQALYVAGGGRGQRYQCQLLFFSLLISSDEISSFLSLQVVIILNLQQPRQITLQNKKQEIKNFLPLASSNRQSVPVQQQLQRLIHNLVSKINYYRFCSSRYRTIEIEKEYRD